MSYALARPQATAGITDTVSGPTFRMVAGAAGAFHGYRRSGSWKGALLYSFLGAAAPVITGAVMIAQGYGKKPG